jgi:hypothetical protein
MRQLLLLVPVLAAGCAYPGFKASRVVELAIPAHALRELACDSHNGDIRVTGDASGDEIALRAELSVRGFTQAEADANLHLLEIGREEKDGVLRVWGKYPTGELINRSPSFTFVVKVPPRFAVRLESHNGDVVATGIDGAAAMTTHNGDIGGSLRGSPVAVTTHNGDIEVQLGHAGAVDAKLHSHNGDIDVALAQGLGARIEASTHNGKITPPAVLTEAVVRRRSLTAKFGDGAGKLVVDTQNGDVTIR